jgi:hypothetical protein
MKFKAYDIINKKKIDLFRITIARDGSVMGVIGLDAEQYGMHQARLTLVPDKKEIFAEWPSGTPYKVGDKIKIDKKLQKELGTNSDTIVILAAGKSKKEKS